MVVEKFFRDFFCCCWFLIDDNMNVNYSLRKAVVYKMAVSRLSVIRWAGKIWIGEREIFAPHALSSRYHVSIVWCSTYSLAVQCMLSSHGSFNDI